MSVPKKKSLIDAVAPPASASSAGAEKKSVEAAEHSKQAKRPPSRKGKSFIGGYFDPAAAKELKKLAIDLDIDELRPKVPTATFVDGELQQGEDVKLPITAFFDDFVLVVTAATPAELIPKCSRVLKIKKSVCIAWHASE